MLKHINERRPSKAKFLPLVIAGVAVLVAALLALALSPLAALVAGLVGALGAFAAHRAARERGRITLDYGHLTREEAARFSSMSEALEALASSEALWRLIDWAGPESGTSEIAVAQERTRIRVGRLDTPGIRASVPIWGIEGGGESLMFFPDALLVYRDNRYEGVSYESVKVDLSFVRFSEKEVPEDAEVVESTRSRTRMHLYTYGAAKSIPVVLYGLVEIKLPRDREVPLQVSNLDAAARFAGAFGAKEAQEERAGAYKPPAVEQRVGAAYKILGGREGASMWEISAAYRKLARVYHPDKVLGLPAEAREISERRMKEINAAYAELKSRGRSPALGK